MNSPGFTRRRAFTIVELLVSLVIMAMVLTAMAFALDASIRAYSVNQATADSLQRARMAVLRIAGDLRSGTSIFPYNAAPRADFVRGGRTTPGDLDPTVTDTGVTLVDAWGRDIAYVYRPADEAVVAEIAGEAPVVLARGVTAFQLIMLPGISKQSAIVSPFNEDSYDLLYSATIQMTVRSTGDLADTDGSTQTITLTGSVAPEQHRW
jgi:prepilin-type N-terminal cleavage/methylation domain-containing protein